VDGKAAKAWRDATRARLRAARSAASPADRARWSAAIATRLETLLRQSRPTTIAAYWPVRDEFDPRRLVLALVASGWRAALPAIVTKRAPMEFRRWTEASEMTEGAFGIPVPKQRELVLPDLVLMPVVGFDPANFRLGYGGGYFDRTLAALSPRPRSIGIGFELSRLPTVHPQPHDLAMDVIVTEASVRERV
jgi:5-formyltetrahydrofolate cyclo-ligase